MKPTFSLHLTEFNFWIKRILPFLYYKLFIHKIFVIYILLKDFKAEI